MYDRNEYIYDCYLDDIDTSEVSTSQPRTRSTYAMWTEDRIRHLIRLYEDHPLLWNNQLSAVSGNQDLRENAISDIAHTLRLDSRDIKKKITSLRDYFIKECQTLERSNDVEQPKSKWIFFDNLAFLKDFLPQLNSRPNLVRQ